MLFPVMNTLLERKAHLPSAQEQIISSVRYENVWLPCFLTELHSAQEEEEPSGETAEKGQEWSAQLPWEQASCPVRLGTVFAL